MRSAVLLWSTVALLSILGAPTGRASEPACTLDQMQADPSSVIAPCTKQIDDPSLPALARAEAFFVRGRGYGSSKQLQPAAQDFDVAAKLAPLRSDIYLSRSRVEYKLGKRNEGWDDLNRALTIDPANASAYSDLGQLYWQAADPDKAMALYSRALTLNPAEPYALLGQSQLHSVRHEFVEALADATALVAIPPASINRLGYVDERGALTDFHVVALDNRARLYESLGKNDEAGRDLDAALTVKRSADTLQTRAEHLMRVNRWDDALKDLDEAVQFNPDDPTIHFDRGLVFANQKRFADGLAAFDRSLEIHSHTATVYPSYLGADNQMRARMLRGLGRTEEAVASLEKAVRTNVDVAGSTIIAMGRRGYWSGADTPNEDLPTYKSALRACMIDPDCN